MYMYILGLGSSPWGKKFMESIVKGKGSLFLTLLRVNIISPSWIFLSGWSYKTSYAPFSLWLIVCLIYQVIVGSITSGDNFWVYEHRVPSCSIVWFLFHCDDVGILIRLIPISVWSRVLYYHFWVHVFLILCYKCYRLLSVMPPRKYMQCRRGTVGK